MILGEPGTGRRTLAATFARQRAARTASAVFMIHGVEGLTDRFRRGIRAGGAKANEVLIHHLESLPKVQQTELAALVHSKQIRLTAVARLQYVDEDTQPVNIDFLSPELDAELRSMTVTLPALRDRGDDSVQWAQHFLTRAANRLEVLAPSVTSRAINAIAQYRWPGNLIELDAAINRALCLSSSPGLEPSDLGLPDGENAIQPLAEAVEQFQVKYVDRAIAHFSGNRSQAARALGVDPRTVFRYLERRKR
jgi:transcriptional regulator with AAA-type ATPase domain